MLKLALLLMLFTFSANAKSSDKTTASTVKPIEAKKLRKTIEKKNILYLKKQLEVLKSRSEARYSNRKVSKTL